MQWKTVERFRRVSCGNYRRLGWRPPGGSAPAFRPASLKTPADRSSFPFRHSGPMIDVDFRFNLI